MYDVMVYPWVLGGRVLCVGIVRGYCVLDALWVVGWSLEKKKGVGEEKRERTGRWGDGERERGGEP